MTNDDTVGTVVIVCHIVHVIGVSCRGFSNAETVSSAFAWISEVAVRMQNLVCAIDATNDNNKKAWHQFHWGGGQRIECIDFIVSAFIYLPLYPAHALFSRSSLTISAQEAGSKSFSPEVVIKFGLDPIASGQTYDEIS